MANDFYSPSGVPSTGSSGSSATMRGEFALVEDAFDKLPALTGNGNKLIAVNSGGTGLEAKTAAQIRALLDLEVGTDVQAYDAELAAIAGLTSAADKLPYFTGSGAASLADLTSVARTLLAQTTQELMRTTGLGISSVANTLVTQATQALMRTTGLGLDDVIAFGGSTKNTQNTDYTLVLGDVGKCIANTGSSTRDRIIPPNSSVAFPIGTRIYFSNDSTGLATITRGSGVALFVNGADGGATLSGGAVVSILKVATDTWVMSPNPPRKGTFTPVLTDLTNDATASSAVGEYSIEGNYCHFNGYIALSSLESVTGAVSIKGFPVACVTSVPIGGSLNVGQASLLAITAGQVVTGFIVNGATSFALQLWDAATGTSTFQGSEMSADGVLRFDGKYRIA